MNATQSYSGFVIDGAQYAKWDRSIFQEMREARALAYSVWAGFAHGTRPTDQAALMGFIDTQPDKAVEAIATMLRLIRAPGIDKERLDTARQAWLAEYRATRIKARDIGAQVFEWREAGIATDPRPEYAAAVRSMSASDLQRFARHFAARPVIVSVLGDRTRIDMQALARIAPVEEVSLSQIFSY